MRINHLKTRIKSIGISFIGLQALQITILFFILLVVLNFSVSEKINAQEDVDNKGDITLSPAFIELEAGGSYELYIGNHSDQEITFAITPSLFGIDSEERRIIIIEEGSINEINLRLTNYIDVDRDEVTIQPGGEAVVNVRYLSGFEDYILGVIVTEQGSEEEIALNMRLASVIVNYTMTEGLLPSIDSTIKPRPEIGIGQLNLGDTVNIESTIYNQTGLLLKSSGEVRVHDGNSQLATLPLTQDLPSNIYPQEEAKVESVFVDNRPFYERLGKTKVTQEIKVNGQLVTVEKEVINIPWQFLPIIIVLLLVLIALIVFSDRIIERFKDNRINKRIIRRFNY